MKELTGGYDIRFSRTLFWRHVRRQIVHASIAVLLSVASTCGAFYMVIHRGWSGWIGYSVALIAACYAVPTVFVAIVDGLSYWSMHGRRRSARE
jgi:hypothetical protein